MDAFWHFMTTLVVVFGLVFGVLALGFLVLLSLPKSRLRSLLLEIFGWGTTAATGLSVVSPIDPIPFVPIDDVGAIIVGLGALGTALYQRHQRAQWEREGLILMPPHE